MLSVGRHTGYNIVGSVIPLAVSLISVPIYLKLIGSDRYGVLAIAWLLLGYFGLFDLGLGRATSFRIASLGDAPASARASTFWAAIVVNIIMGAVGGVVLWVVAIQFFGHLFKVAESMRPEILAAAPLLAASVPVATITGVLTGAVQGRERFLEINIVSAVSTVLFQALPLVVAWKFGPNLSWLLAAALFARLLGAAVLAYRCHLDFTRGQPLRTDREEIGVLMKFGGWVNISAIFGPVLFMIDRFVIGALIGASAVTSYTVPVQLATRTQVVSGGLTTALFPRLSAADPERQRALFERAMLIFAGLMSAPIVMAIFAVGPFLHFWVHERLGPEAPFIGAVMFAAMWFNGLALISFTQIEAAGRPDLVARVLLIEIPPYLILLWLGIHFLGLTGSAIATAIRYVGDFALLTFVAGPPKRGRWVIVANFVLLSIAVWQAQLWTYTDWEWWAAAAVLGLATAALGVRTLPADIRDQVSARVNGVLKRMVD